MNSRRFASRLLLGLAIALVAATHTSTRQEQASDWVPGTIFAGVGDFRGYYVADTDGDPETPPIGTDGDDPGTPFVDSANLGRYKVFSPGGDFVENHDWSVDLFGDGNFYAGQTTGCAVNRATGELYTTMFDFARLNRASGAHTPGVGHETLMSKAFSTPDTGIVIESIVFDANNEFYYVGAAQDEGEWSEDARDGIGTLYKVRTADHEIVQTYRLPLHRPDGYVTRGDDEIPKGIDWIDLSNDGRTLFYTSEDRFIRVYDLQANGGTGGMAAGNPEFGAGIWGRVDLDARLGALRLLPPGDGSGGLLVASSVGLYRLNRSGQVVQLMAGLGSAHYFAVNLTPDAQYAWSAANSNYKIQKFHIASGAMVESKDAGGVVNGLCVKEEYVAVENPCTPGSTDPLCQVIEVCSATAPGDDDGDGLPDAFDPDCVPPGTTEVCSNRVDDDRDGLIDETCPRTDNEADVIALAFETARAPGETRTYSAANIPPGLSLDPGTGLISGTLTYQAAGGYAFTITVQRTTSTGVNITANGAFTWTVNNVNRPPVLVAPAPQVHNERETVSLPLSASDLDGETLTYSATGLPAGLSINPATGLISGTLSDVLPAGTLDTVVASVTDGIDTVSQTFTWRVNNVNRLPVISTADQVSNERQVISYSLAGSDADGEPLTFTATGLPASLSIHPTTGVISGTLADVSAGGTFTTVTVSVTDGIDTVQQSFTWTVVNVNRPPVLTVISSVSIKIGQPVLIQATAEDADVEEALTFSLGAGAASYFTIDPVSGLITGTGAPIGTYPLTVIVTDPLGATDTALLTVTIQPLNDPPVCTGAVANPAALWPPEHQMETVTISGVTDPEGEPITIAVTGISQNEPVNSSGDGSTDVDGVIAGSAAQVRVERAGTLNTRYYRIEFTATDSQGATCTGTVYTMVTHDQGNEPPPPAGPWYDSTQSSPQTAPFGALDLPAANGSVSGTATIQGWALDLNDASLTIELLVDGAVVNEPATRGGRSDVCAAYGDISHCASSQPAVTYSWNTLSVGNGQHTIALRITDPGGRTSTVGPRTVTVNNGPAPNTDPFGALDSPNAGAQLSGTVTVGGWALDQEDATLSLELLVNGQSVSSSPVRGSRPDACSAVPSNPHCAGGQPGFQFTWNTLSVSNGTYTIAVLVTDTDGATATVGSRSVAVTNVLEPANTAPFGAVDAPSAGAEVSGTVSVGGWVLDTEDASLTIELLLDGQPVVLAASRGARPDACAGNTSIEHCETSQPGFTFTWDSSTVANGAHTLAARVTDPAGLTTTFGARQVSVANGGAANSAPFGHLDAPTAGASVSGAVNVGGWALDAEDASVTIQLLIDGQPVGAELNRGSRPDACSANPEIAHCNTSQPGFSFAWETAELANGPHTLAIRIIDGAGLQSTVGYRTITVANAVPNSAPFGAIDAPLAHAVVSGTVLTGGWVLDQEDSTLAVELLLDGDVIASSPSRGAREDVCSSYPGITHCSSSAPGFSINWNTTLVENGTHTLSLRVTDPSGASSTVGSRVINVNNGGANTRPFGVLDAPTANSWVSGRKVSVGGWVLDREDEELTISLLIDGVSVSTAPGRGKRKDVCDANPTIDHCDASRPSFTFNWDSRTVSNGSHTVAIRVTDPKGLSATIGVRTINVSNEDN